MQSQKGKKGLKQNKNKLVLKVIDFQEFNDEKYIMCRCWMTLITPS